MLSTAMRLLTSLLMLWATPGYCRGTKGGRWQSAKMAQRGPTLNTSLLPSSVPTQDMGAIHGYGHCHYPWDYCSWKLSLTPL